MQIIACAGSGKTQVISQRIAKILAQPGVEPRNIIAFTFTEKAAAELKDRILGIVAQERGDVVGLAEMYIGTMHGYCLDLLQRLVPETFKFSVLTDITSRLLVDRNSRKSGLTACPTSSPNMPRLRRFLHSKLFLQAMSVLREDTVDAAQVDDRVWESLDAYLRLLVQKADFDFTELINLAVSFLEADPDDDGGARAVQDHIRADIKYVVVDEYQDVNPLQERLIAGLIQFGANLCVVGDDDQTIYQWRGSQVSNIVTFAERYDGVLQVTLADNFRSSKGVVELARSIADRIPAGERLSKAMISAENQTWERGDLLALTFEDPQAEASWICNRIEALRGVPFLDTPNTPHEGSLGRTVPCSTVPWHEMPIRWLLSCGSAASRTWSKVSTGSSTQLRFRPSSGSSAQWWARSLRASCESCGSKPTCYLSRAAGAGHGKCWSAGAISTAALAGVSTTFSVSPSISSRRLRSVRRPFQVEPAAASWFSTS
jgi:DNA helicase-2/ATP-dependent DNA helicase PcrA